MVNRLVSVGDTFTLPTAVKVAEANLPANLAATALNATYVKHLGNSNGTNDYATVQAALDAARAAGSGRIVGKSGEKYRISSELSISSGTFFDFSASALQVNDGTHVHAIRSYSEKNAVATGTASITSGSAVVTTALASQAVVGQMLRIIGAGGTGLGPLVGKISAVNTGAGTVTLVTLDGRPCVATATVSAAAATLNNVDKNIKILIKSLENGNNSASSPGFGVIFLRHVDGLHIDIDNYTSTGVSRGVGIGSCTNWWVRIRQSNSTSVVCQISGPAANGRIDYVKGTAGDDLVAFTAGDYSDQQSTAGDIVNVTVGSVVADNTPLNVYKIIAGAGWLVDGIKVDGELSGTGLGQGAVVGDDVSQPQTIGGTYGEIDLGYVNLRTGSYPIALIAPNAKRIRAVVRHLPTIAGVQQEPVAIGGSTAAVIEELNLAGSVEGSTLGLIKRNNTAVTIRNLVLSDGVAGYKQTPLPSAANILAARIPIPPFVLGEAWAKADAASLGNIESSGAAWTVWGGTPGITARQAAPTTAANTKAVATAVADGYTEIVLNALSGASGEGWMIFRGTDTNNYWRFGFTTGTPPTLVLQKVVAGGVTGLISLASTLWAPGIRLGVLHSGSSIKLYADGVQVGVVTDAFNQTAVLVGWQGPDTPAKFGPIFSRALVAGK